MFWAVGFLFGFVFEKKKNILISYTVYCTHENESWNGLELDSLTDEAIPDLNDFRMWLKSSWYLNGNQNQALLWKQTLQNLQ